MAAFYATFFSIVGFLSLASSFPEMEESARVRRDAEQQTAASQDEIHNLRQRLPQCIPANGKCPLTTYDPSQKCCFPYSCDLPSDSTDSTSGFGKCLNGPDRNIPKSSLSKCPHMNSLEQILEPVREGEEFDRTVRTYEVAKERYVHSAAYRGPASNNFLLSVRELNLEARAHYADTVTEIGNNIFPLIIAREIDLDSGLSGLGGTYTLYLKDGSSKTVRPTSKEYEIRKALSHVPIGLFSVVAPYFLTPGSPKGRKSYTSFYNKVCDTYEAAQQESLGISNELREQGLIMLNITKTYMEIWSTKTRVNAATFEVYTEEMFPYIESNIRKAASLQANAVYPALAAWKAELGTEEWKRVHALIPAIWPVSTLNPRLQILSKLMSPEQVRNQVFVLDSNSATQSLRGGLGKIIGDRAAALLIFGTRAKAQKEFTFNLAGRQDLMSNAAEDALNILTQNCCSTPSRGGTRRPSLLHLWIGSAFLWIIIGRM